MGWETLAIAGFSALRAVNQMQQGESQARAAVKQGEQEVQNVANNTVISAGKVRNSFLSSGISLEGGPLGAINQIFNTGNTNIARIAENANTTAKNAINSARTQALAGLASTAAMAALGGAGGGGSLGGLTDSASTLAHDTSEYGFNGFQNFFQIGKFSTSLTAPVEDVGVTDLPDLGA